MQNFIVERPTNYGNIPAVLYNMAEAQLWNRAAFFLAIIRPKFIARTELLTVHLIVQKQPGPLLLLQFIRQFLCQSGWIRRKSVVGSSSNILESILLGPPSNAFFNQCLFREW